MAKWASWRWKCQKSWRVTSDDWLFYYSLLPRLIGMIYLVTVYWHISLPFSSLSPRLSLSFSSSVAVSECLILFLNSLSLPVNVIWRFQNEIYRIRQTFHFIHCKIVVGPIIMHMIHAIHFKIWKYTFWRLVCK